MKRLITALLVAAFLALSVPNAPAPEPTQKENFLPCVVAVFVIIVGTVCIIGIYKCCKLINKLDPPTPPPTNQPPVIPTNSIPTNHPAWTNPPLASFPLSLVSTNSIVTIQQSLGLGDWADVTTVTVTNLGDTVVVHSGSLCLTSAVVNGQAVFFLPPVDNPPSDSKFFRMISTP